MRTKSLVLIVIALGCGLVASIGISEVLKNKPQEANVETETILVAAIDIDIGKKLDAQNVKVEEWPKGKVPEGALHTLDDASDSYTRTRLYAGEPILHAKLMDTNSPSTSSIIPDGYVVIPIKVELDTVIGLIQPGDHVDVMVFLRQSGDVPRTGSYTILRMVRVFAVNAQTDRTVDEKGQEINARTVSLLVKPKQSEKLTLASELGKIRLALRRPTDQIPDGEEELDADLPAIFRGDALAIDKQKPVDTSPVPTPTVPVPVAVAVPEVTQPIARGPEWTMQVMSPADVRRFEWQNEKELPQEAVGAATSVSVPATVPVTTEEPAAEESSSQ